MKLPLKIMIADDDVDDRELLKFLFDGNAGFEQVGCFDNGITVLNEILVEKNIPDVVLIDMNMPILTGMEVVANLCDAETRVELIVFIISTGEVEKGNYCGHIPVFFLKKPVSLQEINDLPGLLLEKLELDNNTKI